VQLTTESWVAHYHAGTAYQVFLDGKDVTRQCAYANDADGVVRLFERDPVDHSVRVDKRGKPHSFEKRGVVEIRKLSRADWDKYFGVSQE
jgi:hypothetical protein